MDNWTRALLKGLIAGTKDDAESFKSLEMSFINHRDDPGIEDRDLEDDEPDEGPQMTNAEYAWLTGADR